MPNWWELMPQQCEECMWEVTGTWEHPDGSTVQDLACPCGACKSVKVEPDES